MRGRLAFLGGMNRLMDKISKEEYEEKSSLLKVMSNPIRLCILHKLLEKGECNVSYLTECLCASQSTISQHLGKMRDMGIVSVKYEGTFSNYKLNNKMIKDVLLTIFKDETK